MKPKFYRNGGAVSAEGLKAVSDFLRNDILAGQTLLVNALLANGGSSERPSFCWDDVANAYAVPEHVIVAESLDDDGNTVFQLEVGEFIQSFHETEEDARQASLDYEEPRDIFEWWLVSDWLADKLYRADEPVLRNAYGTWWGRTTTGQDLHIDHVIVGIAAQHGVIDAENLEGAA